MEQSTAITENGVELSEVIANTVEANPVTEVIATIVEEAPAVSEVIETIVEAAPTVTEAITTIVEEAPVVSEVIATIVEEVPAVSEVMEKTVEEAKIVIEVITNTVEEAIAVSEVITNTIEEANSLTAIQKEALDIVFNDVKSTVEHILIDADVPVQIKLMQMISPIIKTVQSVSALQLALTGADKKAVVLECGRKCIKMMLKDHLDMLSLYDTIAEPALETMLDLSRNLKSVHDKLKELEKKEPSKECCLEVLIACMGVKTK